MAPIGCRSRSRAGKRPSRKPRKSATMARGISLKWSLFSNNGSSFGRPQKRRNHRFGAYGVQDNVVDRHGVRGSPVDVMSDGDDPEGSGEAGKRVHQVHATAFAELDKGRCGDDQAGGLGCLLTFFLSAIGWSISSWMHSSMAFN